MTAPAYTNAPAPHGALFDDAPAVTAIPRLVAVPGSDGDVTIEFDTPADRAEFLQRAALSHVTPATRISQLRGGTWVAVPVLMHYGRPVSLALALSRVAIGRTVFVAREDAEAVMDAVREGGSGAETP
jgi:hypothetical protein